MRRGERTALVRFRHRAPNARAVALQASGWWHPVPETGCDLQRSSDGWWEGVFEVPYDWRASYGFLEHDGTDDPPWRDRGMKSPSAPVLADPGNPLGHGAVRGGGRRSIICLPDDGPFARTPDSAICTASAMDAADLRDGPSSPSSPSAMVRELPTSAGEPRARWWAPSRTHRPPSSPAPPAAPARVPLLIVTDAAEHVEHLGTPAALARGVDAGVLPPLAAVFVDSGPQRAQVLGVPGGHARWIARELVPRLLADGLDERDRHHQAGPGAAVRIDPSRIIVTGSSFGGLTSLFALAQAPGEITAAIAQSTSLWRYPEGSLVGPLRRALADAGGGSSRRIRSHRIRLHAGRYEGTMPTTSRALADAPRDAGLDVRFALHSGGHDWARWQPAMLHELADLLRG